MRKTLGIILTVITVCFFARAEQAGTTPDLSGTWVLEATDDQAEGDITLVITLVGNEIRIKETHADKGTVSTQEKTYFVDGRGEKNRSADGKQKIKSFTKWDDDKLIVEFSLPQTRADNRPVTNERIDEWSISRDGKKLKHSSTFWRSWPPADPSNSSASRARTPSISTAPMNWKTQRTFKRVS